jgi:hypothetical protein
MTLGDLFVAGLVAFSLIAILTTRIGPPPVRSLLAMGLLLRLAGGQLYFLVGEMIYGGVVDYWTYYDHGTLYANALLAGTPEASGSFWLEEAGWCCTAFTIRLSGVMIAGLEPSVNSMFALYSLIGYTGILAFAWAFWRAFPEIPVRRYVLWIVFFPSLWYWPAALGKDALILAGIGFLGFVGRKGRPGWLMLTLGTTLVFAVRPQVAVVVAFAFVLGHWMATFRRGSLKGTIQGVIVGAIGLGVAAFAQTTLGVTISDAGAVEEYLAGTQAAVAQIEGSAVRTGGSGIVSVFLGFVNVVARPFLWEGRSLVVLIGAAEISVLWVFIWWRRREIKGLYRTYGKTRAFWTAVLFVVVYAAALGLGAGNLGLIARQRIHLFPFVFMFFAGLPMLRERAAAPLVSDRRTHATA